jgi:GMP synthase (glutamine-hydrolysing)
MQVLAFRHAPLEGIGTIGSALDRHNVAYRVVDAYLDSDDARGLGDADGLIVMGGPMSANDDLPWLRREIGAIQEAVDRGVPVLGVCLGAQLIAKALGARVYKSPEKEIGWGEVRWCEATRGDRLFDGFRDPEMVFQWHGETFDLPQGAELLAYGDVCRNQAFRVGRNVYGMQFHLEVTPEIITDWLRQDAACGDLREAAAPIDPYVHADPLAAAAATVFDGWCGLLT